MMGDSNSECKSCSKICQGGSQEETGEESDHEGDHSGHEKAGQPTEESSPEKSDQESDHGVDHNGHEEAHQPTEEPSPEKSDQDSAEATTREPTTQEPIAQEPGTQEPTTQEPISPEPISQEPTIEEPSEAPTEEFAGDEPTLGPLTVSDYKERWKDVGEHATVQAIVQGLSFDSLGPSQLESVKDVFVRHLSEAAGVKPSDVKDLHGNAPGVSLAGQGITGKRNVMVNCGIVLPFGRVVADVSKTLHDGDARGGIAEDLSELPNISPMIGDGVLQPYDIEIEVEKNGQDVFYQSDNDVTGTLDASEFKALTLDAKYMTQALTPEESDQVFKALDLNGDGELSDTEFFAVTWLQTTRAPITNVT